MAALAAGFPRLRPKFPPRIYSGSTRTNSTSLPVDNVDSVRQKNDLSHGLNHSARPWILWPGGPMPQIGTRLWRKQGTIEACGRQAAAPPACFLPWMDQLGRFVRMATILRRTSRLQRRLPDKKQCHIGEWFITDVAELKKRKEALNLAIVYVDPDAFSSPISWVGWKLPRSSRRSGRASRACRITGSRRRCRKSN